MFVNCLPSSHLLPVNPGSFFARLFKFSHLIAQSVPQNYSSEEWLQWPSHQQSQVFQAVLSFKSHTIIDEQKKYRDDLPKEGNLWLKSHIL